MSKFLINWYHTSVSNLSHNIVPYINAVCYCSGLHYSTVLFSTVPFSLASSVYFHIVMYTILLFWWHGFYIPVMRTFIWTVLFWVCAVCSTNNNKSDKSENKKHFAFRSKTVSYKMSPFQRNWDLFLIQGVSYSGEPTVSHNFWLR